MSELIFKKPSSVFELGNEANRITLSGDFHIHDIRRVFAKIHDLVNNKKYLNLIFDFSRAGKLLPSSMLPLCANIKNLNQFSKIETSLVLPEYEATRKLFLNTGWANIIEPRKFDKPYPPKTGVVA